MTISLQHKSIITKKNQMQKTEQNQNIKAFISSQGYIDKKTELNTEINERNKLTLDRSIFAKSKDEKLELKLAKARYKESLKRK
jgi:hypothetical protein